MHSSQPASQPALLTTYRASTQCLLPYRTYLLLTTKPPAALSLFLLLGIRFLDNLQPNRLWYVQHLTASAPQSKVAKPHEGRLPPNVQPSLLQVCGLKAQQRRLIVDDRCQQWAAPAGSPMSAQQHSVPHEIVALSNHISANKSKDSLLTVKKSKS